MCTRRAYSCLGPRRGHYHRCLSFVCICACVCRGPPPRRMRSTLLYHCHLSPPKTGSLTRARAARFLCWTAWPSRSQQFSCLSSPPPMLGSQAPSWGESQTLVIRLLMQQVLSPTTAPPQTHTALLLRRGQSYTQLLCWKRTDHGLDAAMWVCHVGVSCCGKLCGARSKTQC